MSLDISKIRRDGGTQSRVTIDEAIVAEYAEVMSKNVNIFQPVIVYDDGTNYWLADGFHRLAAWERIGRTADIPVDIRKGDRRRAILHSLQANSTHGLRRSNEDKRHSVMMLLDDEEWSQWSNREIAKACVVSDHLVAEMRGLTAFSRSEDPNEVRTYTTRYGSTAKMRVAKIGGVKKEKATELPEEVIDSAASRADVKVPASPIPERNALAQLPHDELIDTVIGLSADLAEARASIEDLRTKNLSLTTQLEAALAGDADAVIAGLHAELKHADIAKSRDTEEQDRFGSQDSAPNEQVEDIWNTEIPF